jgi:hypothetical protein
VIVAPDFMDHWRTRMLVSLLGQDELAPIYVLRLWAHCQNRKGCVFDLPSAGLQGICRYVGDPQQFEAAMEQSGFVQRTKVKIEVVGWAEYNAGLIAAWNNGKKGGRPRTVSDQAKKIGENPAVTRGETEGRGGDEKENTSVVNLGERVVQEAAPLSPRRSGRSRATHLPTDWVCPKSWGDWALTERPDWNSEAVRRVADEFRDYWIAKGGADARKADWKATWRNWVRREKFPGKASNFKTGDAPISKQEALEARNQQVAQQWANGG